MAWLQPRFPCTGIMVWMLTGTIREQTVSHIPRRVMMVIMIFIQPIPMVSNDSCLTCLLSPLSEKHIAVPSWHPSGNWLLMTVEKPVHAGSSFDALPGLGSYTDIWIMNRAATKTYKLLTLSMTMTTGLSCPGSHTMEKKFSGPTGKRLRIFWCQHKQPATGRLK